MRHKEIKPDLVQQTIDLIHSYNLSKELTVNLVKNFNEFDPHPPENLTYGVGERDPNKLYNKKLEWLTRREYYLSDSKPDLIYLCDECFGATGLEESYAWGKKKDGCDFCDRGIEEGRWTRVSFISNEVIENYKRGTVSKPNHGLVWKSGGKYE